MIDSRIPGREGGEKRVIGGLITIAASATIAWLTLSSATEGAPPPSHGVTLVTDIVLNVILFVPLGIGLALLGLRRLPAVAVGTLASLAIECTQYLWLPSREGALHDVLTNGIGALLGAMLVHAWDGKSRAWRLAGPFLAVGMAVVWIAGASLVRLAVPKRTVWYGFWAHQLGNAVQFPGRILEFRVNGEAIPDGLIQDQERFQHLVSASDRWTAVTKVVTPPPFGGMAQLIGIMSPSGDELLSLWQDRSDLLARVRLRTADARLRTPWFMMPGALSGNPGDTLAITLEATRNRVSLTVRGSGSERAEDIRLSPELFWSAFVPWDYSVGGHPPGWPLLATALIFGAIGLGSTRRPLIGAAIAVLALFLPAPLTGGAGSEWLTVGLALVTLVAGQALGRRLDLGPHSEAAHSAPVQATPGPGR